MLTNLERLIQRIEEAQSPTFTPAAKAIAREFIAAIADDAKIAAEQDWNLWGFHKALLALLERPEVVRGQRNLWK